MISTYKLAIGVGLIISLLSLSIHAESSGPELNHFAADEISFDYPAGYSLTDESTPEAKQLTLTLRGSSVQLTLVVLRHFVKRSELPAMIESFTEPLVKKTAMKVGEGKSSPERTSFKTEVGPKEAEGVRLRTSRSGTKTGEVIWLRLNFRLVSLALIRSDVDESAASELWQTIRSSLKVEAPVVAVTATGAELVRNEEAGGGVLNGKALELPQPTYPIIARAAHASGTVTVQVLIDEQGNVIAAHAVAGHPLLQAASVAAARQTKFSPTLLDGEPVKVTGVINYNFVSRE